MGEMGELDEFGEMYLPANFRILLSPPNPNLCSKKNALEFRD